MADYIYRIETGYTRGWQVRVPGKDSKLFSDNIYGSRDRALEQARAYRDTLTDTLPGPPGSHLRSEEVNRRRQQALSSTGINGFGIVWLHSRTGELIPYAQMHYRDEHGSIRSRKRSLRLAGTRRAVREICLLMVEHRPDYDDVDRLYWRAIRATNRLLTDQAEES